MTDDQRRGASGNRPEKKNGAKQPARTGYARPAGGAKPGEKRYGRPANASGEKPVYGEGGKPARTGYARPAGGSRPGEKRYGRPAGASGEKPVYGEGGKPARTSYARPAGGLKPGEKRYGRPAGASGEKPVYGEGGKPARTGYARPAGGAKPGEKRYGRPSGKAGMRPAQGKGGFARPVVKAVQREPEESTGLSMNARRVALDVLCDVHQKGAFAGLSLDEHLRAARLSPEDRRLVTSIVYGTLENEIRIDFALDRLMDHPTHEPVQRDILRMSAYQILFLDRVPDSAAVNEGVKLVKAMGMEAASGFINAVLRNLTRGKAEMEWPQREDGLREYLNVMGSMPLWIVDRLTEAYGGEEAERVVMYRENEHPVVMRPNLTRLDDAAFEAMLQKKEWRFERGLAPHSFLVYGASEITFDKDYQSGLFSIQGQSSMLAAEAVQAKPGMKVLDACAAPGGKSAYLCESMQMTGRVFAWELHEKRALLLEGVKRRLRLENLRISVRDASEHRPDMDGTLDAVLLDAPCSGLGVMVQKPDVKLRVKEEDVQAIVQAQKKLLSVLCRYVKPGGTLVYSTCSILPEENAEQVEAFLEGHPEFSVEPLPLSFPEALRREQSSFGLQLLGCRDGVEGFFIARMRRKR